MLKKDFLTFACYAWNLQRLITSIILILHLSLTLSLANKTST
jgi:hypothetical protein